MAPTRSGGARPQVVWPRRTAAVGIGLALAAVTLEVALQVAALVVWWREQGGVERPTNPVVLCVGDSLTYGLGTTSPDRAYPRALERELASRGRALTVVGGAWPGQHSADVLRRLPGQLADLRPDVLCVLFGWNDTWARPALVPLDEAFAAGFPLRWRTLRLLQLVQSDVEGQTEIAVPAEPSFVGAWHVGEHDLYFALDGFAVLGGVAVPWRATDGAIVVTLPTGEEVAVRISTTEGTLKFALPGWPDFKVARRGLASERDLLERPQDLLSAGRTAEAIALLESQIGAARADAVRELLAIAYEDVGRRGDAVEQLGALESAWRAAPSPTLGERVARVRFALGDRDGAVAVARDVVRDDPMRLRCWQLLVDSTRDADERRGLHAALGAAIARAPSRWQGGRLKIERALVSMAEEASRALEDLVAARADGFTSDEILAALRRAQALGVDLAALARALAAAALDADTRSALERDLRRLLVTDDEMHRVFAAHVERIVDLGQAAGAHVVLLGYPFPMAWHDREVARIAAQRRVRHVRLADAFTRAVGAGPRGAWFSDEIHLTDRGYELMGRLVAEAVAELPTARR